jgi:hypothetical protein
MTNEGNYTTYINIKDRLENLVRREEFGNTSIIIKRTN